MKFQSLGLAEPILRAVTEEGYSTPTPIQAKAIPHILEGKDLLGCAQTGTGKTAAFALPILHRLMHSTPPAAAKVAAAGAHHAGHTQHGGPTRHAGHSAEHAPRRAHRGPRVLVLSPTRELALQIAESFETYGRHSRLTQAVVFGGVGQGAQVTALKRGVDILVATPGRLLDLMQQGHAHLDSVEIFVLDEADRMLDMGFIADIRKVVAKIPHKRQTLMFSATMPRDIRQLADTILRSPVSVEVAPVATTAELVEQAVYMVDKQHKPALLAHLVKQGDPSDRTIVFTRTKHGADKLVKALQREEIAADAIHGNKRQNIRQKTLDNFRTGRTPVLVATDIAARGIDIDEIQLVVNFDIPNIPETYVHRIGRTGRAGATGRAVAFCDRDERFFLKDIEKLIRRPIPVMHDQPDFPAVAAGPAHEGRRPARAPHHPSARAGGRTPHTGSGAKSRPAASGHKPRAPHGGDHAVREPKPGPSRPAHQPAAGHGGQSGHSHRGHSPGHKPHAPASHAHGGGATGGPARRNFRGRPINPR